MQPLNPANFNGAPDEKIILGGSEAFYKKFDYLQTTRREFLSADALPTHYRWNTENKIVRIAKTILSIIIFPIAIYKLLHALVGYIVLPAALRSVGEVHAARVNIPLESNRSRSDWWVYKRLTIEVDGHKIDTVILGKPSTMANGKWVLVSNGNYELYEYHLNHCSNTKRLLDEVKGNALLFNYPSVGGSKGFPNRAMMAKVTRAMLAFLEDKERGIGALEIIGYGLSIGGGVQGEALKDHPLKEDVKYVFVKDRTFSNLSNITSDLTNKFLGFLVKIFGWNIDSIASSKRLQAPEIILQTAAVDHYTELLDASKIIDDDIITANASLAKALLEDPTCPKNHKMFIGIPETHNELLRDTPHLAESINNLLR